MDVRVVTDADYKNLASEDRDEAARDNYDPDSDTNDDRDDGFGVAVSVAVAVSVVVAVAVGIAVGVGVRVAVVVAVFAVVQIAVLSAANDPYSLYPSLYVSFAMGIVILGRAVASD